ncbi:hypothetical protein ACFQ9L_20775, partial [Bacillus velezensis]
IDTWYSVHRSSNLRENKERPAYYVAGPGLSRKVCKLF